MYSLSEFIQIHILIVRFWYKVGACWFKKQRETLVERVTSSAETDIVNHMSVRAIVAVQKWNLLFFPSLILHSSPFLTVIPNYSSLSWSWSIVFMVKKYRCFCWLEMGKVWNSLARSLNLQLWHVSRVTKRSRQMFSLHHRAPASRGTKIVPVKLSVAPQYWNCGTNILSVVWYRNDATYEGFVCKN